MTEMSNSGYPNVIRVSPPLKVVHDPLCPVVPDDRMPGAMSCLWCDLIVRVREDEREKGEAIKLSWEKAATTLTARVAELEAEVEAYKHRPGRIEELELALERNADLLYRAWSVIANAPGWYGQAPHGWRQAAERWRDDWHATFTQTPGSGKAEDTEPPGSGKRRHFTTGDLAYNEGPRGPRPKAAQKQS